MFNLVFLSITTAAGLLQFSPCHSVSTQDTIPIDFQSSEGNGNRGDANCPVSGRAYSQGGLVAISFSSPLGSANIRLDNLETGYYTESLVIASGSTIIPFTVSSGQWQVTVTLSDGTVYSGYFVL